MATIIIGRTLSSTTDSVRVDQGTAGAAPWPMRTLNAFVSVEFDEVALAYNAQRQITTAVYKNASVTVATLTLTYANGLLTTVARS